MCQKEVVLKAEVTGKGDSSKMDGIAGAVWVQTWSMW